MLENRSKDASEASNIIGAIAQPIPDPWDLPSPTDQRHPILDLETLPKEPHPLLAAVEKPEALLAAPKPSVAQMLLQDELKLKVFCQEGKLAMQIQKALALLGWMGTRPNIQFEA